MSFQGRYNIERVVVCDICGRFGAIGDWDWRRMRDDQHGEPLHLCRHCRPAAVWCAAHQQYHLRDSMHRRPCAACGGLFTSQVRDQIEHCPQCLRSLPKPAAPAPERSWPGFAATLHTLLAHRHRGSKAHRA